jgi:guanylate kinase
MRKGFLFVISGPSAVGKTSVVNEVLKRCNYLERIITCTTRPQRVGESDGVDYFFMSREAFVQHSLNGDFVEHSEVYGNNYGVLFSSIMEKIDASKHVVLILNWEGFLKIKELFRSSVVGFFIAPPSIEALKKRIRNRNSDAAEDIAKRLEMALEDMSHQHKFDYCCENNDISETADKIWTIIAEKCQISPD